MAIYRCAACGSPKVMTDTQTGGVEYSYLKGAVGTVVLGAGGAAAGIQNKKEQVFKCPDCGVSLSYPMPEEIKILIDMGVESASARKRLKLRGVEMDWAYFTQKYAHIESGAADKEIERQLENQRKELEQASATAEKIAQEKENALHRLSEKAEKEKMVSAPDVVAKWIEYRSALESYFSDEAKWKEECAKVEAQRSEWVNHKIVQHFQHERDRTIIELEQKLSTQKKRKADAEEKLATLAFFKFSEKSTQKRIIEDADSEIASIQDRIATAKKTYQQNITPSNIHSHTLTKSLHQQSQDVFPLPPKSVMPKRPDTAVPLEILTRNEELTNAEQELFLLAIPEWMERGVQYSTTEIKGNIPFMACFSNRETSALIWQLIGRGILNRTETKRSAYYSLK